MKRLREGLIQGKYNTAARYAILVFSKRDWDFLEPLNTQP